MSREIGQKFAEALHLLEEKRDLDTILVMYTEDCEVGNVVVPEKYQGHEGARKFWTIYRETFDEVHSEFRNIFGADNRATLEWTTSGTTKNGGEFSYDGVSILEIEGDKVSRFRAYFDASALGRQVAPPEVVTEASRQASRQPTEKNPSRDQALPTEGSDGEAVGTGAAAGGYGGTSGTAETS